MIGDNMRRKDREITSADEIIAVIERCKVMHLAMIDNGKPYVVPLNFGYTYENGRLTLYFHCASQGRKTDILKKSPDVCFEMDGGHRLIEGSTDCAYGYGYESVIGSGRCEFITDSGEKIKALTELMKHQTGVDRKYEFDSNAVEKICVCRITADEFSGKARR